MPKSTAMGPSSSRFTAFIHDAVGLAGPVHTAAKRTASHRPPECFQSSPRLSPRIQSNPPLKSFTSLCLLHYILSCNLRTQSRFQFLHRSDFVGCRRRYHLQGKLAMHAAATFGHLLHVPQLQQAYHSSGERCTSSGGRVGLCSAGDELRRTQKWEVEILRAKRGRIAARRGGGEQRFPVGEYGERIVVSAYEDDEDDEDEIKLECDENGCVIVKASSKNLEEQDGRGGFLSCDLSGCYFSDEPPVEKTFEVIEGEGWRLGYETAPESEESFCAIVGAGGWSLALTASEFNDFCYLIQTLRKGISTMDEDGFTGKEEVVMQMERGSVWMACSIPKKSVAIFQNLWKLGKKAFVESQQNTAFELRFILSGTSGRRQAEGFWPPEAVMDMLRKIDVRNLELEEQNALAQEPAAADRLA